MADGPEGQISGHGASRNGSCPYHPGETDGKPIRPVLFLSNHGPSHPV